MNDIADVLKENKQLRERLESMTKLRDHYRQSAAEDENEIERLRQIIAAAPHSPYCEARWDKSPCDCWKRDALRGENK